MELEKLIENRKKYLERLIKEKKIALERSPEGILKTIRHGKSWQYYHRKNKKDHDGTYIRKNQMGIAKVLAQKAYDSKIIIQAQKEYKLLTKLERASKDMVVEDVFQSMSEGCQLLVNPIEEPIERFVKRWRAVPFEGKPFSQNMPEYYSEKGERMRSKSEVLIANMLKKYDIPYIYEKPLFLKGIGWVYPDFTILHLRKREEIYYEHFGLLDDREYREKALAKLSMYEKNEIFPGERLLISYETMRQPLNMKLLEKKIQRLALDMQ